LCHSPFLWGYLKSSVTMSQKSKLLLFWLDIETM